MNPPHHRSRRQFLSGAGLAAGAALLTMRQARAEVKPAVDPNIGVDTPPPAEPRPKVPGEITLTQTGWNVASTRFIDPPTWTWEPLPGATGYIVMLADENDKSARTLRLTEPRYDMAKDWPTLDDGMVTMIVWAIDDQDRALCAAWPNAAGGRRFCKSPGFDGVAQKPLDWTGSMDRLMGYLLAPARDQVFAYEDGMPRSCWSSCEDSISGQRRMVAFPALHHPSLVFAYLEYARAYPNSRFARNAVRQAKQYGDWLLRHRQPADWRCALFPFSTIEHGHFAGYIEGSAITLFRAARVGEAMIGLAQHFREDKYLAYARHLADKFVELQRPDGSWPYRVNPKDGSVKDDYTSAAITPARLMGMLEKIEPNARYARARAQALQWVLRNPVRTRQWQGMYEDVAAQTPFRNLQHQDTNETIWYLMHYHRDDAESVRIAENLNRYIEDQFVVWQSSDRAIFERTPTPIVLEQYACYRPIDGHAGLWIRSLLALHRATGNADYLTKAINAGNTIVRSQHEATGAYSTWGLDVRFQRPLLSIDWPGSNAVAMRGLLDLALYLHDLPASRASQQPL